MEATEKKTNTFKRLINDPNFKSYSGIILVIIVLCIFMSFRSKNFMTYNNMMNVLRQISVYGILACGMAFAMMTGIFAIRLTAVRISFSSPLFSHSSS